MNLAGCPIHWDIWVSFRMIQVSILKSFLLQDWSQVEMFWSYHMESPWWFTCIHINQWAHSHHIELCCVLAGQNSGTADCNFTIWRVHGFLYTNWIWPCDTLESSTCDNVTTIAKSLLVTMMVYLHWYDPMGFCIQTRYCTVTTWCHLHVKLLPPLLNHFLSLYVKITGKQIFTPWSHSHDKPSSRGTKYWCFDVMQSSHHTESSW